MTTTVNATFNGIELTERETAALAALAEYTLPVSGARLANKMQAAGRPTSTAAAHQAGAALARKGLAIKGQLDADSLVRYEINNPGRAWIEQYRKMGGRP